MDKNNNQTLRLDYFNGFKTNSSGPNLRPQPF